MATNERGAITIHVAISLMALLMFAGWVIDGGVWNVARTQAQVAADAGALAGAKELSMNPSGYVNATAAAKELASPADPIGNSVWGQTVGTTNVAVNVPVTCPDGSNTCIRVDVYRGMNRAGAAQGAPINTFLVRLVGPTSQALRATAMAQVAAGNAVQCIKPWVVADKWTDNSTGAAGGTTPAVWDQMDSFDPGDTYTPGVSGFTATGPNNQYGLELVLKQGQQNTISSGWTMEIDLGQSGASPYREEIRRCPNWVPEVGLYDPTKRCLTRADENPEEGCLGVMTGMDAGPTRQGVGDLIALDQSATWNTQTNSLANTCMDTGTCVNTDQQPVQTSPRVVPLAIYNPATYLAGGYTGTNGVAQVMNLLGFFIEGMCDDVYPNVGSRPVYCGTPAEAAKAVVGRLMAYPGQSDSASGPAGPATFLKVLRLVK